MTAPAPKFTFTQRAAAYKLGDSEILNSNNPAGPYFPDESDVVVAGAGVHGLIYAIQAAKQKPGSLKICVVERNTKPGYKIGESTLPLYSFWCQLQGLGGEHLLRLFGLKDGLAFYTLDRENQGEYSDFTSHGPPAPLVSTWQIERPMNELLLTLLAQRFGVDVYHGRKVDFQASRVQGGVHHNNKIAIVPKEPDGRPASTINSSLLVDATGRFRQYASKNARLHRFKGWNCDAFWGYFTAPMDESKIPFRFYEGPNTNHICFPEGWIWVIRLPSWQGNPTANLMDMVNYVIDCAHAGTHSDEMPTSEKLAKMFGLKFRWVTSIGFAVRNDFQYPEDMSAYGTREAERKFNFFVEKYVLIKEFMSSFELIPDHYGPGTTWFIRKTLTFQSPVVSGPGWVAIGDACGFTNPLYSPGITVGMSTSTYAAELTHQALSTAKMDANPSTTELSIRKIFAPYDSFAAGLIPAIDQMNRFNYECFRSPRLALRVGCLWQFYAGAERCLADITPDTFTYHCMNWAWGSKEPEYDIVAKKTLELLSPIPLDQRVPDAVVDEVIAFSEKIKADAMASGRLPFRFAGLLRYFDGQLNYDEGLSAKSTMASRCSGCGTWLPSHPGWRKCISCGNMRSEEQGTLVWSPPLTIEEFIVYGNKFSPEIIRSVTGWGDDEMKGWVKEEEKQRMERQEEKQQMEKQEEKQEEEQDIKKREQNSTDVQVPSNGHAANGFAEPTSV